MAALKARDASTFSSNLIFLLASISLILVPLHGVLIHSLILLILEILGLFILLIVFWSGLYKGRTYRVVLWFLFISLVLACLYIVPIPKGSSLPFVEFDNLPGRSIYYQVERWLASRGVFSDTTLSLIPYVTTLALLALLPPISLFFAGLSVTKIQLRNLVYLLLFIAGAEAVIGLIQYASGNSSFYFGIPSNGRSAQGTYLNRDHFVALLELTLPIAIGLMLYSIGRSSYDRRSDVNALILNQVLIFGLLAILLFLAGIFARSRTGVFLIMIAVLVSSVVFARHIGGKQSVGLAAAFATIAFGLAASIGLIPVLNRFVSRNPVEDERFRIFEHTIQGIKAFFPFGSGPGTFSDVYRAFQPIEQLKFVNNAHNDYLELLFEMGAFGAFIIIGFFYIYILGWFKLRGQTWSRMHFIKVGAGIGIFLFLLHLLSEFLLHEPMNTMVFALLTAVFLRKA